MKYLVLLGWCTGLALLVVSPTESFLRPLGALFFFGFSLVLIVLYVRFAVRSLKAGRRSVGLAMIGGLPLLLGLLIFQRLNLPGDEAKIAKDD